MSLSDPWRFARPHAAAHYIELLADAPRRPLAMAGNPLFSRETRERVGQRILQPGPAAPATIHNGLQQLQSKGVLAKSPQRGHYQFEDEQLREWVAKVAHSATSSRRN